MKKRVKFYGAAWCPDCIRAKKILDEKEISYNYINIDENSDAALEVERINKGFRSIPTIIFPNGSILVEPSNKELEESLMY